MLFRPFGPALAALVANRLTKAIDYQGIDSPLAAAKSEYHSSRLRETDNALTHARNRSGREVPRTG